MRVFYNPSYCDTTVAFDTTRKAAAIAASLVTDPIPGHRRVGCPGADHIDVDSMRGDLPGQMPAKSQHAGLRGGVGCAAENGHAARRQRRDVYDLPVVVGHHDREHCLGTQESALQADIHDQIPL